MAIEKYEKIIVNLPRLETLKKKFCLTGTLHDFYKSQFSGKFLVCCVFVKLNSQPEAVCPQSDYSDRHMKNPGVSPMKMTGVLVVTFRG